MGGISNLLDKILYYSNIFQYVIVGILIIVGGLFLYFRNNRVKLRKKEDTIDYSNVKRKHCTEFVNIEDIKNNMIINDDYTYFTMGIKCVGFDYKTAHKQEQHRVIYNYIEFINMIEKPIQYFLQCRNIDVEKNIEMYERAQEKCKEEIEKYTVEVENFLKTIKSLEENEKIIVSELEKIKESSEKENKLKEKEYELNRINELIENTKSELVKAEKRLDNSKWQFDHLSHQIAYGKIISSPDQDPQRDEYYVFSYTHNKLDFSVELTKEEITERAAKELTARANQKIAALKRCNVTANILTSNELVELMRRCFNPKGADRFKFKDVLRTNFFSLVTTTDDFKRIEKESIVEKAFEELENKEVEEVAG